MSKQVREIYSSLEKRNGLKNSRYHREQLQTWIKEKTDILESGTPEEKFSCLEDLMQNFCRRLDMNEQWDNGDGKYHVRPIAEKGLYSGQKTVLKIIARQFKYLKPDKQHALLKTFIEKHLEQMGHLALDAAHDPQRKAIKMLAKLLPKLTPTDRADLTALLTHKLTDGKINSEQSVKGIFKRKAGSTSDVAVQLVAKEFLAARRMRSNLHFRALADLEQTYEVALSDYTEQQRQQPGEPINLHSHAWKKAFNNEKLNPSGWTEEQRKRFPWEKSPRRYIALELSAMKLQVARLEAAREAELAQMQAAPRVHGEEYNASTHRLSLSHGGARGQFMASPAEETMLPVELAQHKSYSTPSPTGGHFPPRPQGQRSTDQFVVEVGSAGCSRSGNGQESRPLSSSPGKLSKRTTSHADVERYYSLPPTPSSSTSSISQNVSATLGHVRDRRKDSIKAESTRSVDLRDSRPAPSGLMLNGDLQNDDSNKFQRSLEHLWPEANSRRLGANVEAPTRERLLSSLRRQNSIDGLSKSPDRLVASNSSQDTPSPRERSLAQPKPTWRTTEETLVEQQKVSQNKDHASIRLTANILSEGSHYEY